MALFPFATFAIDTPIEGYSVGNTQSVEVDAHGVCKILLSKSATTYFVPTKTSAEWVTSFLNQSQLGTRFQNHDCSIVQSQCAVGYRYRLDNGASAQKFTPATNNTGIYQSGAWAIRETGKDDHCNSGEGCGLRASVACTGDYDIKVDYQYVGEGISAPLRTTGWSNVSTSEGSWSSRTYETGDNECSSSDGGCDIKMWIEDDHPDVTCSISYRHRTDETVSGWAADGAPAKTNNNGSGDGENCEDGGCGMQVRIYCDGPNPGHNASTHQWSYLGEGQVGNQCAGNVAPSGICSPNGTQCYTTLGTKGGTTDQTYVCGTVIGGTSTNGSCGPANGQTYALAADATAAGLCNLGTPNPSPVQGLGPWSWTCEGIAGGSNATCSALTNATTGTWAFLSSGSGSSNANQLCPGNIPPVGTCSPINDTCRVSNNIKGGSTYDTYRCNAPAGPVNGTCGDANGGSYSTATAVNNAGLCSTGSSSPSGVSGSGPWSWNCIGANGGSNATCSAAQSSSGTWVETANSAASSAGYPSQCAGNAAPSGTCSPLSAKCHIAITIKDSTLYNHYDCN